MAEQPQTMTEAEWLELGEKLFGKDLTEWRFKCPACGNVMSSQKARAMPEEKLAKLRAGDYRIEQECVGRHLSEVDCNWCAYGLFSGPFFVTRPSGGKTPVFGFDVSDVDDAIESNHAEP